MGLPSYMRSVVDRNVVMRRMTVLNHRALLNTCQTFVDFYVKTPDTASEQGQWLCLMFRTKTPMHDTSVHGSNSHSQYSVWWKEFSQDGMLFLHHFLQQHAARNANKMDICPATIEVDQCKVHCLQTAARRYRVPIDAEFLTCIKHRVACDLDQRCDICAPTCICLLFYTQPPRLLPWKRTSHSNGSRLYNSSGYFHAYMSWA